MASAAPSSSSPFTSLRVSPTVGELPQFVDLDSKYLCPICKNPMDAPVQTECGHRMCLSCVVNHIEENSGKRPPICPIDDDGCEEVTKETIYPDYNMKKQIEKQMVFCKNKKLGCDEHFKWRDLSPHLSVCKFRPKVCQYRDAGCRDEGVTEANYEEHVNSKCQYRVVECKFCKEKIPYYRLDEHRRNECLESVAKCPNNCSAPPMKRKELRSHLADCQFGDPICPYSHMGCTYTSPSAASLLTHEEADMSDHLRLANIKIKDQNKEIMELKGAVDKLKEKTKVTEKLFAKLACTVLTLEGSVKAFQDREETHDSLRKVSEDVNSNKNRIGMLESGFSSGSGTGSFSGGAQGGTTGSIPEDMRSLVANHDTYIKEHDSLLKQLDFRILCQEGASFDGLLLWKIHDFTKRKLDARNGEAVSIYSQPFYTHRFGYKMCIRGYLNGDGIGKNSHLSLFFVLMKGEFDALLKWPFNGKVTFNLVDQEKGQRNIQDVFRTDPTSSSFKRPQSDMNVATGCPRFAAHDVLEQKPFMLNDTIYIRVVVESVHTVTR